MANEETDVRQACKVDGKFVDGVKPMTEETKVAERTPTAGEKHSLDEESDTEKKQVKRGKQSPESEGRADGRAVYRVTNSLCLRQPLSIPPKIPNVIRMPYKWLWAEKPEDFFCVAETDQDKNRGSYQICSKTMLENLERIVGLRPQSHTHGVLRALVPFPISETHSLSSRQDSREIADAQGSNIPAITPRLRDFIPDDQLPGVLGIQGSENLIIKAVWQSEQTISLPDKAVGLKRLLPPRTPENKYKTMTLTINDRIGSGNHASVFRGTLRLSGSVRTDVGVDTVGVAVKISTQEEYDRHHLSREAMAYTLMSKPRWNYLQKDWPGYVVCSGRFGFSEHQFAQGENPTIARIGAVVPKFFGYYIPRNTEGLTWLMKPCRLILIEDCGQSAYDFIQSAEFDKMDWEFKVDVYRTLACQVPVMLASLHSAGFLQRSFKWENIAIQPGPLSLPAPERSYRTPSLRILDFGRGRVHSSIMKTQEYRDLPDQMLVTCNFEDYAKEELLGCLSTTSRILKCIEKECYCCVRQRTETASCYWGQF